jgi:hypothetical protein
MLMLIMVVVLPTVFITCATTARTEMLAPKTFIDVSCLFGYEIVDLSQLRRIS